LAALEDPEIDQTVVNLTERTINEERDIRDILALIALSETLGQTSSAMAPFLATPTPAPTSTPTLAPTPTPRPTLTPTPLTPVPTATGTSTQTPTPTRTATPTQTATPLPTSTHTPTPTTTPTPGPNAPFGVVQSVPLCTDDTTKGGLLRIYVRDRLGEGVPGAQIVVTWPGGRDSFFTGFKPEIDPGYADFQMRPGETYRVELGSLALTGSAPEVNLDSNTLCPNLPADVNPSWQVVFRQGQ
jgi:hypothetical protein